MYKYFLRLHMYTITVIILIQASGKEASVGLMTALRLTLSDFRLRNPTKTAV